MYSYNLGSANIDISEVVAGSLATFTIEYTVGDYGFDDGGEILIARRDVSDSDIPQLVDQYKTGYVKVYCDPKDKMTKIKADYMPLRYVRPWRSAISIRITDGSLTKDDKVYIQFGAKDGEGYGFRMQTFKENEHILMVLVDCAGTGEFYEIDNQPTIKVTGGYINELDAVVPSTVSVGQKFDVTIRVLDSWGNIAEKYSSPIVMTLAGNEKIVEVKNGLGVAENISIVTEGNYCVELTDEKRGITGSSNPMICRVENESNKLFWGDMHGQTKETVGTGTQESYFTFGRDCAKMDFCAWQGNDFQVTDETWANVCKNIKKFHEPGKFVTFLGYEWSGNTPNGGDYNIYFRNDDEKIFRSSHWQIDLLSNDGTDRSVLSDLWEQFKGRNDVIAVPHVGGRYANLDMCNTDFVSVLEIHSHHGTFEWMMEDAFARNLKLGVIAASDDHTCRPGLSYPTRTTSRGFVSFDGYGGYTGLYAKKLTREAIWEAIKSRHTYGTTGKRIILDVKCGEHIMGDMFATDAPPIINVNVAGTEEIRDVEIKRGNSTIYSYEQEQPIIPGRIKVQWSGVRVKSRSKKTVWDGNLVVDGGSIKDVQQFAFDQPDEGVTLISNQIISWKSSTSGDIDGMEIDMDFDDNTKLMFNSPNVSFSILAAELKDGPITKAAGGINQKVTISLAHECFEKSVEINFEDKDVEVGTNPYWVKVTQSDGNLAWSSPMYIDYVK